MNRKIALRILEGLILAGLFGVALWYHLVPAWDQIFTAEGVKFAGVDAYYHMRILDNLVANFPHLMSVDPYFIFPGANGLGSVHFFDYLIAFIIWVIGLG
ncbi:hypothetical protein, partial [Staphylococcus aureus]